MIERYQTKAMSEIWSDEHRLRIWTQLECAVTEQQFPLTETQRKALETLKPPTIEQVTALERETNHDFMAFLRALEQQTNGAIPFHRGLTTSDIVDSTLSTQIQHALTVITQRIDELLSTLRNLVDRHRGVLCIGRTHGIWAEPLTLALKFGGWYAELQRKQHLVEFAKQYSCYGTLSGPVGNYSSLSLDLEQRVLTQFNLSPEPLATQVVPRDRHAVVLSALAIIAAGAERIATEIRAMQRSEIGELSEPFTETQRGSSAMPHKRNPILCERVCGLARILRGYVIPTIENIALWGERDISHSSVERVLFPSAFHALDYQLAILNTVLSGLEIHRRNIERNLARTQGIYFSQQALSVLVDRGVQRDEAYRLIKRAAESTTTDDNATFAQALRRELASTLRNTDECNRCLNEIFDDRIFSRHEAAILERIGL